MFLFRLQETYILQGDLGSKSPLIFVLLILALKKWYDILLMAL